MAKLPDCKTSGAARLSEIDAPAVLPSLLLCDFTNLEREIARLEAAGVRALHLDVMDGVFVPNLTYGPPIVKAIRRLTKLPLDVHLMIVEPQRHIEHYADAGADVLTIHAEAVADPARVLEQIRSLGIAAGLAINPGTSVVEVVGALELCDVVLVMSVMPGAGGQKFQEIALEKLSSLKGLVGDGVLLEVDGGVNASTIPQCVEAGADLLVVGSAIFNNGDYSASVLNLENLARSKHRGNQA